MAVPNISKLATATLHSLELDSEGTLADLRKAIYSTDLLPQGWCFSLDLNEMTLECHADATMLAELGIKENTTVELVKNHMLFANQLGQLVIAERVSIAKWQFPTVSNLQPRP
jgi:hypothetical protein